MGERLRRSRLRDDTSQFGEDQPIERLLTDMALPTGSAAAAALELLSDALVHSQPRVDYPNVELSHQGIHSY
jgi:hypothetical protein